MAELALHGVAARHGSVEVLHPTDLAVADGEVLAVVGPSGSGKSTLLRVVAGLHPASAGAVVLGGRDVTALAPAARDVAMVFQSYALFPHLDVAANIGFGLSVRKVPRAVAAEQVRRAAEQVGCAGLLDRRPDQLSGGERQRVALARALVRNPDVLLLDEPLSNLDAQLRVQLRAELQRLRQRVTTTTVHVTHDQVEALTLGDRVAVLHDGAVQQVATPAELWDEPANRFVATFVGSPAMNVLPARHEHGCWVAGPLRVPASSSATVGGHEVELGVRPEHLALVPDRSGAVDLSGTVGEPATVVLVEVVGGEAWVHVAAVDGGEVGAPPPTTVRASADAGSDVVVRVPSHHAPPTGSVVRLRVEPTRCHLFDAATGRRVGATGTGHDASGARR